MFAVSAATCVKLHPNAPKTYVSRETMPKSTEGSRVICENRARNAINNLRFTSNDAKICSNAAVSRETMPKNAKIASIRDKNEGLGQGARVLTSHRGRAACLE